MDIYERYGRKQEQLEKIQESFQMTIELLKALKSGEADINRVEITDKGWSYGKANESD